jgi:hypothetical protein
MLQVVVIILRHILNHNRTVTLHQLLKLEDMDSSNLRSFSNLFLVRKLIMDRLLEVRNF